MEDSGARGVPVAPGMVPSRGRDLHYWDCFLGSSCLCFCLYPGFSERCVRKMALGSRNTPLPPSSANSIRYFSYCFISLIWWVRYLSLRYRQDLFWWPWSPGRWTYRWQSVTPELWYRSFVCLNPWGRSIWQKTLQREAGRSLLGRRHQKSSATHQDLERIDIFCLIRAFCSMAWSLFQIFHIST